jgi:2-polyprenyl-3-methyl-5-hydroxy-6-metoxy-1,4-benzoquinol methylase
MSGPERYATVTNYNALYGTGYFAHDADSASFNKDVVPRVVADICKSLGINAVADVGAGNGMFGKILKSQGVNCVDIDVNNRNDDNFIYFDISGKNQDKVVEVAEICSGKFPCGYIVTSFDMAEHVDLEHLPDFLYNFAEIIQDHAVISISTRPSSRANIYHSSILPIDTWKYMFSLVGLQASPFEVL